MIHDVHKIQQITCDWCGNTALVGLDAAGRTIGNVQNAPNAVEAQLQARGWFGEVFTKSGRVHACSVDCTRKLKNMPRRTTPDGISPS